MNRRAQEQEFFATHQSRLLAVSQAFHWNPRGEEWKEWQAHLLPDGYECPEDETFAELLNALEAYEEQARQRREA